MSAEDTTKEPVGELLKKFSSSMDGLSESAAKEKLAQYGFNEETRIPR
jgi:hypothetical protein